MAHRTNSQSKITKPTEFHLHLEIIPTKLAVSLCILGTSNMHYLLLLERIFLEALEKLLDL